jgi:Tfp pilus assembly protein PilN
MSEWTEMVEQAIQRCKGAELQARKERKMWETLKRRLPEAETHPFAIRVCSKSLPSCVERSNQ